jgi:hypothetical protein
MPGASIVADPIVGRAVSAIVPNADQQPGSELLERTFVDIGILAQLEGPNSQILFGRRGTGKSHLLRLLTARKNLDPTTAAVFIDVRRLGSAQLMTDTSKPLIIRITSVFRDLLGQLQSHLLDLATDPRQAERIDALESVSILADSIATVSSTVSAREVTTETGSSSRRSTAWSAGISRDPSLSAGSSSDSSASTKFAEHYTQVLQDTVIFGEIASALEAVLTTLGLAKFFVVLDEWSAIPADVQPYIAEFLKRTILPIPRMSVKVGSLTYQSVFRTRAESGQYVGLEFGADVTRNLDLDEYYTFENNPTLAMETFTDLLWRHLTGNISPADYLQSEFGVSAPGELRRTLFSDNECFADLLRSASGVARDFLSIFTAAYFRAAIARTSFIDQGSVQHAVLAAFQTEKLLNLDGDQERCLRSIAGSLREHGGGNIFLLDRALLADPMIQSLFDMRVIHIAQSYYTGAPDAKGSFSLYSLDYGASLALGVLPKLEVARRPSTSKDSGSTLVPDLSALLRTTRHSRA